MTKPTISEIKRLNLLRIMAERGLKNADLAKKLNAKPPQISALLKKEGKSSRNLGQQVIDKLCVALNVDEIEFYRWDVLDEEKDTIKIKKPSPHIFQQMLDVQFVLEQGDPIIATALNQNIVAFKMAVDKEIERVEFERKQIESEQKRIEAETKAEMLESKTETLESKVEMLIQEISNIKKFSGGTIIDTPPIDISKSKVASGNC